MLPTHDVVKFWFSAQSAHKNWFIDPVCFIVLIKIANETFTIHTFKFKLNQFDVEQKNWSKIAQQKNEQTSASINTDGFV